MFPPPLRPMLSEACLIWSEAAPSEVGCAAVDRSPGTTVKVQTAEQTQIAVVHFILLILIVFPPLLGPKELLLKPEQRQPALGPLRLVPS